MAQLLKYGPTSTAVGGLASITFPISPLNFVADFSAVEEGPGKVVYTDVTAPIDRPSTLRIARVVRPNIYAGTGISDAAMLPSRKGTDTVVEIKEVWELSDSLDPMFLKHLPVRAAITLNLPQSSVVTADAVERLIGRAVAAVFAQADGDMTIGINALLHDVVRKK